MLASFEWFAEKWFSQVFARIVGMIKVVIVVKIVQKFDMICRLSGDPLLQFFR